MNGFKALLKKELKEQLRTNRIIIVAVVFLFFGIAAPPLTKFLPELVKMAGDIVFDIPPPTAVQALIEYAATMSQFGVLVIVLVAMGAISKERESGTAAIVLSKPVGYPAFVVAKFVVLSVTTTIGVILGALACCGYTLLLFDNAPALGFLAQNILLLLYLLLAIAITLLFSSMFRSQLAAGALGLVTVVVLTILSSLPWVGKYLPGELLNWGIRLVDDGPDKAAWWAVVVTCILIAAIVYLTWTILRKKELSR